LSLLIGRESEGVIHVKVTGPVAAWSWEMRESRRETWSGAADRPLSREAHRLRMARLIHCISSSFGRVVVGGVGGVVEVVDVVEVDKMGISASKSSSSEFKTLAWVDGRRWRLDVGNVWRFDDLGRCFGLCSVV